MPFEMLSPDDKIDIGAHLYVYWVPENLRINHGPIRWYREGERIPIINGRAGLNLVLGRTPCFDTATVEKLMRIDAFKGHKCEAGITDYIEITLIDGSRWFCTDRARCDGDFIDVHMRAMHDEWVVRARI
jgi:hypothetical protein